MEFSKEQMIAVTDGEAPGRDFEVIEQSEWTQDGKYQHQETIFRFKDKFFSIYAGRSGSPFTDWYYESEDWGKTVDAQEVHKAEVTTYQWVAK
jgi:hypothetical protein